MQWVQEELPGMPARPQPRGGHEPCVPDGIQQLRIIVTAWRSGHTTVDVTHRRWHGPDRWDRRTGHLDLDVTAGDLAGKPARDLLTLLGGAAYH